MTDHRQATAAANRRLDQVTSALDRVIPLRRLRPLERLASIKLKLAILIVAAVGITAVTSTIGYILDIDPKLSLLVAVVVALILMQILARGITTPLRDMADAADRMAAGDLTQRVAAPGADEVGQLARSFNEMAAEIAALEQQRRDLIANVSHELRTPIAVIQGNVENLLDGVVDDEDETLQAMLRQTRRLGRLVEQLLDLSRLEAGAAPLHARPTELVGILDNVVEEATMRDPAPRIDLRAPERVPLTADPERLHQVFANLVDNAIRHQPEGETLTIGVEPGPDRVTVEVSDRGPGIPAAELRKVFDRFHRTDTDRAPTTGGSGLGLAIAKGITELHDGTIEATNSAEGGCTMRVSLPTGGALP